MQDGQVKNLRCRLDSGEGTAHDRVVFACRVKVDAVRATAAHIDEVAGDGAPLVIERVDPEVFLS